MSLLIASGLAKSYGALDVFEQVEVRVEHGDRIGLVGPNGQGKTTLLKILAGLEPPSAGMVTRARGLRIGYLPQDPPSPGAHTLYADLLNVFAGLQAQGEALYVLEQQIERTADEAELERLLNQYGELQSRFELTGGYWYELRICQVLSGLGFQEEDYHRPLAHLSGGQRTRALLARLLLEQPDLLLLDEPTNHLDLEAMEWLEETLLQWKGALVVVAHDRYFLDRVVTRVWELAHGRLEAYRGNYSYYIFQRQERLKAQQRLWEKQQEYIAQTEDFIRRYRAGQRSREARGRLRRLERFKAEELIERPREQPRIRLDIASRIRSGDLVLATKDLVVGYDSAAPLFHCPDLEIRRGHTVALIGPNGAGKTTFLKTILGEIPPLAGRIRIGASVEIGYLAQTQAGLNPQQTVLDAILEVAPRLTIEEARRFLGRFLFTGDDAFQTIGTLSGGQRSRIALARLALKGANFLILDEPTNHLDLESQETLQDVLSRFSGTILLVTHDRYLAQALATHIWELRNGELRVYEGGYNAYLAQRAAERGGTQVTITMSRPSSSAQEARERMREERRQRQAQRRRAERAAALEHEIQALESELAQLASAIDAASRQQALDQVQQLGVQYVAIEERLHQLMEEWASLV
ncbi:MAG: ABC-F family ATP-binding cassette domain-containing protein [Anaerolineae bacterium]|nr:ABC-F family ATP-binding cassette domain-containing protein [Anaerolineae bacterium]MDW8099226.1 ABC-F family ATP-binding cassette domain-containing protein [Anaerolineae bacterium]